MEISNGIYLISISLLLLSLIIAFVRLFAGPTVNDRVTAMDLIASVAMGLILIYSAMTHNRLYFDIALILSLVSFIGTVAISTYLKDKN
jgi:multicomponent Na+:H+ antiporter subunit F